MAPKAKQAASLLAQAENAAAPCKKRRLSRRTTEEQVNRAIAEHFGSASSSSLDLVVRDGKTLRQRLGDDKRAARESGQKLGSGYWRELKDKYQAHETQSASSEALKVSDKTLPVDKELKEALELARGPNLCKKHISRLVAYLQSARLMNQREFVGLLRVVRECKPSQSNGLVVIRESLRYIVRVGADKSYPAEVRALRAVWDDGLTAMFASMKKSGVRIHDYWKVYGSMAGVVIDSAAVGRILDAKDNWNSVASDITEVSNTSKLGDRMFGFAHVHIAGELVAAFVQCRLHDLGKNAITATWYAETLAASNREADRLQCKEAMDSKRQVELSYRGIRLTLTVNSLAEELSMRLTTAVKERAAGKEIPFLFFEEMFGSRRAEGTGPVDEALWAMHSAGRVMLNEGHQACASGNSSGEYLVEATLTRMQSLCQVDSTIVVEMELIRAVAGPAGTSAIETAIIAAMPEDENDQKTLADSIALVGDLMKSPMHRCICRAAQANVAAVHQVLVGLQRGIAPQACAFTGDHFLQLFGAKVRFFIPVEVEGDKRFFGVEALEKRYARLAAIQQSGRKVSLADLEPLSVYKYTMPDASQVKVADLVDAGVKANATVIVSKGAGGAKKVTSKKMSKAAAANQDDDDDDDDSDDDDDDLFG